MCAVETVARSTIFVNNITRSPNPDKSGSNLGKGTYSLTNSGNLASYALLCNCFLDVNLEGVWWELWTMNDELIR